MAKIIVVTSGKGGVGKTTTSAAFGTGLALRGHKTVIVDFDVGLRNLDLIMGCERRVVYDLVNVVNQEATVTQAMIKDKRVPNLYILPASQTRDKDALTKEGVERVLKELSQQFDYIICDSPAGIERGAQLAMYFADTAIIVTNPEVSSVRDSDRILGILASKSQRAEQGDTPIEENLLVTRYSPERVELGEMLSLQDVQDILSIKLLGVIPESKSVLQASNAGVPVIMNDKSEAGIAYADVVARFLGEKRPHRFTQHKRKGLLQRLFKARDKEEACTMTMRFIRNLFKPTMQRNSAVLAKERLQIIVSHERSQRSQRADFLPTLQKELVDVIAKYVKIDAEQVKVALRQRDEFSSVLELNITLPERNKENTDVAEEEFV